MNINIGNLNKTILKCKKCPRLVNFIQKISREKRKQNINEHYWGKPVTGFGKINSKILMLLNYFYFRKLLYQKSNLRRKSSLLVR